MTDATIIHLPATPSNLQTIARPLLSPPKHRAEQVTNSANMIYHRPGESLLLIKISH